MVSWAKGVEWDQWAGVAFLVLVAVGCGILKRRMKDG